LRTSIRKIVHLLRLATIRWAVSSDRHPDVEANRPRFDLAVFEKDQARRAGTPICPNGGIDAPDVGPLRDIVQRSRVPLIDVGTIARIESAEIAVRKGIERFESDGVTFVDGQRHVYDAIVLNRGAHQRRRFVRRQHEVGQMADTESGHPQRLHLATLLATAYESASSGTRLGSRWPGSISTTGTRARRLRSWQSTNRG